MLRQVLGFSADGDDTPVISEMLSELTQAFADPGEDHYDVDAVLFSLAMSVIRLELAVLERDRKLDDLKASLLNLEARILEAGVRLPE